MPNMLLMSAFKVGNPVEGFILMETCDLTRGSRDFCLHGFHIKTRQNVGLSSSPSTLKPERSL